MQKTKSSIKSIEADGGMHSRNTINLMALKSIETKLATKNNHPYPLPSKPPSSNFTMKRQQHATKERSTFQAKQ
jgi:hypothetical protein